MTKATILIVDDEKNILSTLSRALRIEDYEVDVAGSAAIALQKAATRAYDGMLLDVMMPEMDGITMLRELREQGNEVPVIVMSGHGTIDTAVEATRLGAHDFIEKPIASERLLLSLERALELALARGRERGAARPHRRLRRTARRQRAHAAAPRSGAARGERERAGAGDRRARDRQRAGGASDPPRQQARGRTATRS